MRDARCCTPPLWPSTTAPRTALCWRSNPTGYNQTVTAAAMARRAAKDAGGKPHFTIGVGDSFYDNGLASWQDPRFSQRFTNIYNQTSLQVMVGWGRGQDGSGRVVKQGCRVLALRGSAVRCARGLPAARPDSCPSARLPFSSCPCRSPGITFLGCGLVSLPLLQLLLVVVLPPPLQLGAGLP